LGGAYEATDFCQQGDYNTFWAGCKRFRSEAMAPWGTG
jgi:hypothetical protein